LHSFENTPPFNSLQATHCVFVLTIENSVFPPQIEPPQLGNVTLLTFVGVIALDGDVPRVKGEDGGDDHGEREGGELDVVDEGGEGGDATAAQLFTCHASISTHASKSNIRLS
tara:strand:+ start:259 stop:597 length:339 start_codon:yes stop_codon:yes gene_type:complete